MNTPLVPLPPVTLTVTPAPLREPDTYDLAVLAREIAMGLRPLRDVLAAHSLTQADYDILNNNPFFKQLLDGATQEWQSVRNTKERTALEAAALFEQIMPTLYDRIKDSKEALNHVVAAAQVLARAGGIGDTTTRAAGEKFTITINLGGDKVEYTSPIDITPDQEVPHDT
jgi:hypothetical protein